MQIRCRDLQKKEEEKVEDEALKRDDQSREENLPNILEIKKNSLGMEKENIKDI